MSEHKFYVGQAVEFFPDPGVDRESRGRYTIVRLPRLRDARLSIGLRPPPTGTSGWPGKPNWVRDNPAPG
jgi:hypothetical protein